MCITVSNGQSGQSQSSSSKLNHILFPHLLYYLELFVSLGFFFPKNIFEYHFPFHRKLLIWFSKILTFSTSKRHLITNTKITVHRLSFYNIIYEPLGFT